MLRGLRITSWSLKVNPSDRQGIMRLSNRVALRGGITGIGFEAAKLFREEDATFIIVAQDSWLQPTASQPDESVSAMRVAPMPARTLQLARAGRYRHLPTPGVGFDAPRAALSTCWHSTHPFGVGHLYLILDSLR
jgi:hypothetical protein